MIKLCSRLLSSQSWSSLSFSSSSMIPLQVPFSTNSELVNLRKLTAVYFLETGFLTRLTAIGLRSCLSISCSLLVEWCCPYGSTSLSTRKFCSIEEALEKRSMSKSFATRLPLCSSTLTSSGPSPSGLQSCESSESWFSSVLPPL